MDPFEMLTREDYELIVRNITKCEDICLEGISLKRGGQLEISFRQENEVRNLNLFIQTSSSIDIIFDEFRKILPKFKADFTPKLYYTKANLSIYENVEDFQNQDAFNLESLQCVLETLAQMHAASFAFEETKSKELEQKFKMDEEYNLPKEEGRQTFRRTICHGNLHSKNILFKTEKCKLINFTSTYYGVPINDVLQLIFFNTSEELRQYHFHSLLEYYYDCLEQELEKYDLKIIQIFPKKDLLLAVHHLLPLVKGEDSHTSKLISKEDCYLIIKNKFGTTNYKFLSFKVTHLSKVSGFLGEYHKLEIMIDHLGEEKTINCFIKCSPRTGTPFEIARDVQSFSREVFMYKTLVRQMQYYEINTINECLPSCYFYRFDDLMVFEDMSCLNYESLDALKPLNFDLLSLSIKKLARFHACSIVLEEKAQYRLIDRFGEFFTEPLFFIDEKHLGARSFMTGIKSMPAAVDLFPEIKCEKFEKFWPKLQELFYTVIKTSDRYRNVLSHGDLWTSNMLVKFEDQKPIDCVLIDFQIVRYCPPAYDLLSLLHLTTDRSTRLKHEEELIQIYYDELRLILESYGLSVANVYPYEDYISCINYMRPQMIIQAAIDIVLTMCTPEEISSFLTNEEESRYVYFEDRAEFMRKMCQKSELYKNRLRERILDIYDYCNTM